MSDNQETIAQRTRSRVKQQVQVDATASTAPNNVQGGRRKVTNQPIQNQENGNNELSGPSTRRRRNATSMIPRMSQPPTRCGRNQNANFHASEMGESSNATVTYRRNMASARQVYMNRIPTQIPRENLALDMETSSNEHVPFRRIMTTRRHRAPAIPREMPNLAAITNRGPNTLNIQSAANTDGIAGQLNFSIEDIFQGINRRPSNFSLVSSDDAKSVKSNGTITLDEDLVIKVRSRLADCTICWERPSATMLRPCGHVCICQECVPTLKSYATNNLMSMMGRTLAPLCPLCRTEFTEVVACLPSSDIPSTSSGTLSFDHGAYEKCWTCGENRVDTAFVNCGHSYLCIECSSGIKLDQEDPYKCLICMKEVQQILNLYFA